MASDDAVHILEAYLAFAWLGPAWFGLAYYIILWLFHKLRWAPNASPKLELFNTGIDQQHQRPPILSHYAL